MKVIKWLDKNFELMILAGLLIIMSVLAFGNVIMRYFFHHALSWSDEVCCYCLALSAFFSLPCAVRMNSSIKVDTLTMILPKKAQKILGVICKVGMVLFLVWLMQGTTGIIRNAAKVGQASPALQIPLEWLYAVMAFTVALTILRYVEMTVLTLMGRDKNEEGEA